MKLKLNKDHRKKGFIYRLIDILSKKNLVFLAPSKYKINDPFEGWLFERLFEECSKKYPSWAKYYKEFEKNIFFLCLSSDRETDQIWKTYTPHALGVCA